MKERTGSDLPAHSRKIAALAVLGGASSPPGSTSPLWRTFARRLAPLLAATRMKE